MTELRIVAATSSAELDEVRALLIEYRAKLGTDLCFQNFDDELRDLPGCYAPPDGRMLLALRGADAIGCIALRRHDDERCEMKRLYVRPQARGTGLGRMLVSATLAQARSIGYREVVLDTLPDMLEAQRLYESFGFRDIAAYYPNPIPGTRYLGKALHTD